MSVQDLSMAEALDFRRAEASKLLSKPTVCNARAQFRRDLEVVHEVVTLTNSMMLSCPGTYSNKGLSSL